jgi:surface protein
LSFKCNPEELQCGRSYLLYGASAFNQDIGSWNVGSVTTLYQTFYSASAFNQNIGSWSTASVTTMYQACFLLRFGALMMCGGACRSYWEQKGPLSLLLGSWRAV